ncbi:hypothetical protein ACT6NV_00915 [Robiginitalea sp. IMCC44478]|uniref:hypothetical protein n=1 Tax=Robiginitalea sp. IMCC44478 TaxID=3459122 RepID=UPI004041A7A2
MFRYLKILLLLGLFGLAMNSCYYDEALPPEPIPDVDPDVEISFREDIEPLFSREETNCTQCHNGVSQDPDLRVGNAFNAIVPTYVNAGDAEGSLFYQRLPGRGHRAETDFVLSISDISQIKSWIDRGAENN